MMMLMLQCIKCDIRRSARLRLVLASITLLLTSCVSLLNVVSKLSYFKTRHFPQGLSNNNSKCV